MSYISQLMDEYSKHHPEAITVESALNTSEGALHFEDQMKKAMTPRWEHFERARVESMIAASTRVLR